MSSSTWMFSCVALAAGRIRMVCEAQDVVNVLVFDVLVDSTFPVLPSASTLSEKAPLTSPSRWPYT